jgi:hypothetical protein
VINRREFSRAFTVAVAGISLAAGCSSTSDSTSDGGQPNSGFHTSFPALRHIDAGTLSIGYAEAGPADGAPVILLHGWPYDIYSYVDVAPLLAASGYRVIVPYLRGFGTTRFLSGATVRNGQQSVVALDVIALMDALKIQRAVIGGFDWGGPDGMRIGGAVAGSLQGTGLCQRVSDHQPEGELTAVAADE